MSNSGKVGDLEARIVSIEVSDRWILCCGSSSPAVKRRRSSNSASVDKDDVPLRHARTSAEDKSPMFNQSSADRPTPSLTARSSSGLPSKDTSMNPRVSISPLRSDGVRPSKNPNKGRTTGRVKQSVSSDKGKLSERGQLSSGCEMSEQWFGSDDDSKQSSGSEKDQSDAPARRRSRNIQLTSLFDSLTRFFSADSDRRRRTAYVNATVSLAQSSLNPRHSFTGIQPEQQAAPQPTAQKPRQKSSQPTAKKPRQQSPHPTAQTTPQLTTQKPRQQSTHLSGKKARQHSALQLTTQKARQQPSKLLSPATVKTEVQTPNQRGKRSKGAKNVKRPAKRESVEDSVVKSSTLGPADAAEMKDLLMASVAESESKLFHTAQTIAQQVVRAIMSVTDSN